MRNKRLFILFGILLSLTLLIAIGSAVFGIRTVDAYCYNVDDEELRSKILENKDKLLGKSIFTLNENDLIAKIEDRVGGIKVVNIERLFPNRVSINYVKLYDYFEIFNNGTYYVCAIDGRVLKKQETVSGSDVIKIFMDIENELEVGDSLLSAIRFDSLQDIVNMLERLDFRETDATAIIKSIDLKYSESSIYVTTEEGVIFKLLHNTLTHDSNVGEKLRKALSLYKAKPEFRSRGMITVTASDTFTYSETSDYFYEESNL